MKPPPLYLSTDHPGDQRPSFKNYRKYVFRAIGWAALAVVMLIANISLTVNIFAVLVALGLIVNEIRLARPHLLPEPIRVEPIPITRPTDPVPPSPPQPPAPPAEEDREDEEEGSLTEEDIEETFASEGVDESETLGDTEEAELDEDAPDFLDRLRERRRRRLGGKMHYRQRAHIIGLLTGMWRAIAALVASVTLVVLAELPENDRKTVMLWLGIAVLVAFYRFNTENEEGKKRPRVSSVVIIAVAGGSLAALASSKLLMYIVTFFLVYGFASSINAFIRWYCTHYILTTRQFRIVFKPPWFTFMKDRSPVIFLNKVENVIVEHNFVQRMFPVLDCAEFTIDGAAQNDEDFHNMRNLRHAKELGDLLSLFTNEEE